MSPIARPAAKLLDVLARPWRGWQRSWLAWAGIVCALSGLSTALYRQHSEPSAPSIDAKTLAMESLQRKLTGIESARYAERQRAFEAARREFAPQKEILQMIERAAGMLAIFLGIGAAFRRENARLAMLAVGLGTAAVFFDVVMVILAVLLIVSIASSFA